MSIRTSLVCLLAALSLLLPGCSFFQPRYTVELFFLQRSPWEEVSGRAGWYQVRYLVADGEYRELYLPADRNRILLEIPKGIPLVAAAYPFGAYAPVGAAAAPERASGRDSGVLRAPLTRRNGPVADALIAYRSEFSEVLPDIDLSELSAHIWEETERRPWAADWGTIYMSYTFEGKKPPQIPLAPEFQAELELEEAGRWICDHRGIDPLQIESPGSMTLSLPSGTYAFFNREAADHIEALTIYEDGTTSQERKRVPVQLR